ncbi:hypothetical protein [Mycobacterium sp. NAZ190054]|uniref:hypothetical protein n=1 Tax=Mycobacterium sp. NAZ190054 TaxID=1747766 RepID=UPI000794D883|nr:hypothetical protein [Mycobacterium sp. NAZ190054]KWX68204.1 hypothetical protein ASJ79_18610 [Mycobacterium sp. NAZ190054]
MTYLLRPFVLCVRYWPQLAACYLLGLLGRRGAIELAAWAGHDNDVWAALIMPLAGLARLGSYVAMFFVLRRAIPVLAALPRRSARRVDVFSTVIVPFFAIYLAWKMFAEDWIAFETQALDYRIADAMMTPGVTELHPETLPIGTVTWVLIVAALVLRIALSRFSDRLPGWMIAIRVYVDALWVFLGVSFAASRDLTVVLNPSGWLAERRIVAWFNETRADLFSHLRPLEVLWDTFTWAVSTVFGGATIPLLWLAVAAIVYGVSMPADWRDTARRIAGRRADRVFEQAAAPQKLVRERWSRLPDVRRREARDWLLSKLGNYRPIVDSARLILHGGVLALALYVLGYLGLAWLDMAGSFYRPEVRAGYLFRGAAWLLGPHPASFWDFVRPTLIFVSHLIVEPLRVCLIASTVAFCLERVRQKDATAASAP